MECSSEEREMEVEALQSIYGKQFSTGGDENITYEVNLEESETKIIFAIPGNIDFLQRHFNVVTWNFILFFRV